MVGRGSGDRKAQGSGKEAADDEHKRGGEGKDSATRVKAEIQDVKSRDRSRATAPPSGPSASQSNTTKTAEPDNTVANAYARRRQPSDEKSRPAAGQGSQPKMREWGKATGSADSKAEKADETKEAAKATGGAGNAKRAPAPTSRQRSRSPSPRPDESKRVRKDSGNNRTFDLLVLAQ
jgi:hypothetical protein